MGGNLDVLAPVDWSRKDRTLDAQLGHDVIERALAYHLPFFMPGNNFIIACRDLFHLEVAIPVGDGIVRMPHDHHLGVHPNVTGIATYVDESLSVHGASRHLVLERKR